MMVSPHGLGLAQLLKLVDECVMRGPTEGDAGDTSGVERSMGTADQGSQPRGPCRLPDAMSVDGGHEGDDRRAPLRDSLNVGNAQGIGMDRVGQPHVDTVKPTLVSR